MRYAALVCTVFVTTLLVACGGSTPGNATGGAGNTPMPPTFTPTPTADAANAQVLKFEILPDDSAVSPREVTIQAGKSYVVEFTNKGQRPHKFQAQRWRVDLFAPAGQSAKSDAFTESVAGTYPCFDAMDAARNPDMKCTVTVQ